MNAVRIFNEKEADELVIADIEASLFNKAPNLELIYNLAKECRMPLCYAGGVNNIKTAEKIISLGVEKLAIGTAAINNINFINEVSQRIGSQSVVVVLDVKKNSNNRYTIYSKNGSVDCDLDPVKFAKSVEEAGAGEILLNSIDNDGMMNGYDIEITKLIKSVINIPMTVVGGAGNISHFQETINKFGPIGLGAGSFFVFKGKLKAVLINYPNSELKRTISYKNQN